MTQLRSDRGRLLELLRRHSLQFGDFTLRSGRKSRFYFDSKKTTLLAEGAYLAAVEFLRAIRDLGIEADAIGGMTLGADPIVCPVAALSHLDGPPLRAFIVRKEAKEHGTGRQIEGGLEAGSRVIVVDDVVTTGGATLQAIEAVEAAGHEIVAVLCLVDREEGGTEKLSRWPFHALFKRTEVFRELDVETRKAPGGPGVMMNTIPKRMAALVAQATLLACILTLAPPGVIAGDAAAARLEGLLVGVDGRPAGGYTMHLIDAGGGAVGQVTTSPSGLYSFGELGSGEYSLGIESPQGNIAPVAAPPVRVARGELVRRDVKLMQADASTVDQTIGANYAVGIWWAGLSTPAKIWTVIGAIVIVGVTVAALDDDDDDEPAASPLTP